MKDPSSVFETPGDVVVNTELSREQKIDILRQWKQEVELRLVAADENMPGDPQDSNRLQEISKALVELQED